MQAIDMKKQLWVYDGVVWVYELMQRTFSLFYHSNGRSPNEIITGDKPDISKYLDFDLYDWVPYINNDGYNKNKLGRIFEMSHRVGPMMSYWILPISCRLIF
jgi:hypothetical protein